MKWWWLSFADAELPAGEQFLGVVIVPTADNRDVDAAAGVAHLLGLNPGGEIMGFVLPAEEVPAWDLRLTLLSEQELRRAGLVSADF